MTTFVFVRHGESLGNQQKIYLGHTDWDLSPRGYLQAKYAAEAIEKRFKVDKIYASDLMRARHTADALAQRLDLPVAEDRRLREIFAGEWEGKTYHTLTERYPQTYGVWRNDIGNAACDGGETVAELLQRVYPFVTDLAEKNQGKCVVLATHATVIRTLACKFYGSPLSYMKEIPWAPNGSLTVAEYNGNAWRVLVYGDDSFMEDIKTALPDNV